MFDDSVVVAGSEGIMRPLAKAGRTALSGNGEANQAIRARWLDRLSSAKCTQRELVEEICAGGVITITERSINRYVCGHSVPDEVTAIEADRAVARIKARRWAVGQ